MGNTRDLFKKIRDIKGTIHAKMGTIKDRDGMNIPEAEDIIKRWQEYTEKLNKKYLHDPDSHDGVITHLEPDILEWEVKVGLRKHHYEQNYWRWWNSSWTITNPERWCCQSAALKVQQIWKTQQCPQNWKSQSSFQSQRMAMSKNVQTATQLHSPHMSAK